jgi:hypothetical protein
MKDSGIELADHLALTLAECAAAIGVSERHLRTLLADVPHLYLGNRLLIPVKPFEEWLREQAKAEKSRSDRVAEAIIAEIRGDRR